MWCICTVEYYSASEKNEIMPFTATWMCLEVVPLSEAGQTEKEKDHLTSLICGIYKEMTQMKLSQNRKRLTDVGNELMVTRGKDGGERQLQSLG